MLQWLVLSAIVAVAQAGVAAEEPVPEAAASPVVMESSGYSGIDNQNGYGRGGNNKYEPNVVRVDDPLKILEKHHHLSEKDIIVKEVYSPDYAEPTWILDYRYLKTGGRDYSRADGGQILILPKGIHDPSYRHRKQFENYDELLEFLKMKSAMKRQGHSGRKNQYHEPRGHKQGQEYGHSGYANYDREHQDYGRNDELNAHGHRSRDGWLNL